MLLPNALTRFSSTAKKSLQVILPFGRKKLALLISLNVFQSFIQIIGIASVFPFLALAADPAQVMNSQIGRYLELVLPQPTTDGLLVFTGVAAIALLLLANLSSLATEAFNARYVQSCSHWLRMRVLEQISSQPYAYFPARNTAHIQKKILDDVTNYINCVLHPKIDIVSKALTVVLLVITLFWVDPIIATGMFILSSLFYLLTYFSLGRLRQSSNDRLSEADKGVYKGVLQLLTNIKDIKLTGNTTLFLDKISGHDLTRSEIVSRLPLLANGPRYFLEPLLFGCLILIIIYYASEGRDFAHILPSLGVIAFAAYRLLPSIQILYSQASKLDTFTYALDAVYDELSNVPPPDQTGQTKLKKFESIELINVGHTYETREHPAFEDICLMVRRSDRVAIMGASGAGKSTMIDIISGLITPTAGQLRINGYDVRELDLNSWHKLIAYVPQEVLLLDESILMNITFSETLADVDQQRLDEVLKETSLHSLVSSLPAGLLTPAGDSGALLSGGQRQRIGLARALYRKPEVLILDETTSALDTQTEHEIVQSLASLPRDLTVILVSHRLSSTRFCDRTYALISSEGLSELESHEP